MQTKYYIKLNTINKVRNFLEDLTKIDSDVDLMRGRYVVDARSALGIMSLPLTQELICVIHSDNEEEISLFKSLIQKYITEEEE